MDAQAAARRWAATWTAAWQAHDVEAVVALYADDCVHRSTPFRPPHRGRQAVRDYVTQAFADEQRIDDVRFGTPVVQGDRACVEYWARFLDQQGTAMTLAGCAMARFDADGLITEARDYWHLQEGHQPPHPARQDRTDKEAAMAFLAPDFEVPELLATERFRVRPLTIHDVVKDYDAVMTSRGYLWDRFGQAWGWPSEDLTLEQDLIDLASHQKEAQRRSSFAYAVMRPDERVQLGCVYIAPSHKQGFDATAVLWVRASEVAGDLDEVLYATVRRWLADRWPFTRVAWPGRELPWKDYDALPDQ